MTAPLLKQMMCLRGYGMGTSVRPRPLGAALGLAGGPQLPDGRAPSEASQSLGWAREAPAGGAGWHGRQLAGAGSVGRAADRRGWVVVQEIALLNL